VALPLPPEGASAILHHDTSHAPAMAAKQGIRSSELLAQGIVDRVIPEFPDAAEEPESFCFRVGAALSHELAHSAMPTPAEDCPNARNASTGSANPIPLWHKRYRALLCGASIWRSEPDDGWSTTTAPARSGCGLNLDRCMD